jgi:endonuclease-3
MNRGGRTAGKRFPISRVLGLVEKEALDWKDTALTQVGQSGRPFRLLIGCVLSLRTKDETTYPATERLFALADTPETMADLPTGRIETAIYPVGFYRTKAKQIGEICRRLIAGHGSRVPADLDALLELPGVGRKTANLVLGLGFAVPAICVDTHVHRIPNRWGYLRTANPFETEMALRKKLSKKYWIPINEWLVLFGQQICKPVSPLCSRCPVHRHCGRVGVKHSR